MYLLRVLREFDFGYFVWQAKVNSCLAGKLCARGVPNVWTYPSSSSVMEILMPFGVCRLRISDSCKIESTAVTSYLSGVEVDVADIGHLEGRV